MRLLASLVLAAAIAAPAAGVEAIPAVADERWGGAGGFAIASRDADSLVLDTPIGRVELPPGLVDAAQAAEVATLVSRGASAGITGTWLAHRSLLIGGTALADETVMILADDILRREPLPTTRVADAEELEAAATDVSDALPDRLSPVAREAVRRALAPLRGTTDADADDTDPELLTRLVRGGWLRAVVGDGPAVRRLESAVEAIEGWRPVERWRGTHRTCTAYDGVAGERLWTIVPEQGGPVVLRRPRSPRFHPDDGMASLLLRISLPEGSDPLAPTDAQLDQAEARLERDGVALVSWNPGSRSLSVDHGAWREVFPERPPRLRGAAVPGHFPPHLALVDARGDVRLLATGSGALRPPSATTDPERFLHEAAAALPDAAHLALFGAYCFAYCHDSPDPRMPGLIGAQGLDGEIHQTAAQTIATAVGGVCRGDCDDLAELYQAIAERQGRLPIVISLPAHAAVAWAEREERNGKQVWRVSVLQTGPALSFTHSQLPAALQKAYRHFEEGAALDTASIGLLLRFAGENTRTPWRLSWRIFAEPDYARTMIEVQRDWHYRTYARAIRTMQALVAAGDDDTANHHELAGLYRRTGQWDECVASARRALERMPAGLGRIQRSIEVAGLLTRAGRHREAGDLVAELADQLEGEESPVAARLASGLPSALDVREHPAQVAELFERFVLSRAQATMPTLRRWLHSEFDPTLWNAHPELRSARGDIAGAASLAAMLLERAGGADLDPETRRAATRLVEFEHDELRFRDGDGAALALGYAGVAAWYRLALGPATFDGLVDAAAAPTQAWPAQRHAERTSGIAQVVVDAPWIRVSLPWWLGRAHESLHPPAGSAARPDVAAATAYLRRALVAHADGQRLQLSSRLFDSLATQARVQLALLERDRAALAAALATVAADGDRDLTENTAELIGATAEHLDERWFADVLAVWREQVDSKPFHFAIAWVALTAKAPAHARLAAHAAAARHPDDPAFAEERDLIDRLIAERAATPGTPPPAE